MAMNHSTSFEKSLGEFTRRLPELVLAVVPLLSAAHDSCAAFRSAFNICLDRLTDHLRQEYSRPDPFLVFPEHIRDLDPSLDEGWLNALLVQHLLLKRLMACVFPVSLRNNFIARELDAVLLEFCRVGFNQAEFLASLDSFYLAIEQEFCLCTRSAETQHLLSEVCERFINRFDPELAEACSVKYTPPEIVNFMCASVEEQLQREFGRTLSSLNTPLLDPCCGVGTFAINMIGRIERDALPHKYLHELFGIEIMALPYYLAKLNIEQEFCNRTGRYEPFPGMRYANALG